MKVKRIVAVVMCFVMVWSFPITALADRAGAGTSGGETSDTDESRPGGGHHIGDRDTGGHRIGDGYISLENSDVFTNLVENGDGTRTLNLRQRILSYYGLTYGFKQQYITHCTGEGFFVQKSYFSVLHDLDQNTMTLSVASYVFSDKEFSVVANTGGANYSPEVDVYKGIYYYKTISFTGINYYEYQGNHFEIYLQGLSNVTQRNKQLIAEFPTPQDLVDEWGIGDENWGITDDDWHWKDGTGDTGGTGDDDDGGGTGGGGSGTGGGGSGDDNKPDFDIDFTNILTLIYSIIKALIDFIVSGLNMLLEFATLLLDQTGQFAPLLGSIFTFLPEEFITFLLSGIVIMILIGIIKR